VRLLLFSSISSSHNKTSVYVIRLMSYLLWELIDDGFSGRC
jgi:hypothetical protein